MSQPWTEPSSVPIFSAGMARFLPGAFCSNNLKVTGSSWEAPKVTVKDLHLREWPSVTLGPRTDTRQEVWLPPHSPWGKSLVPEILLETQVQHFRVMLFAKPTFQTSHGRLTLNIAKLYEFAHSLAAPAPPSPAQTLHWGFWPQLH